MACSAHRTNQETQAAAQGYVAKARTICGICRACEAKEGERMRDLKPNKNMTEIEYIEWIIDLFFANKRAYKRRADNDKR
jgi:hypothetical protein